jgi:hypothetical protein
MFEPLMKVSSIPPSNMVFLQSSHKSTLYSNVLESSKPIVFVLTDSLNETRESIFELAESVRESHFQVYQLTDIDKQSILTN